MLLGEGSGGFAVVLAYLVECVFDGFPVQDAVAAIDPFPGAEGAELRCGDRRLDAQAVQVLEVIVGREPRMAAGCGVSGGEDLEVVGGPREHALLAVKGFPGRHEDEGDGL